MSDCQELITIRICERKEVSFKGQAACLAHPSGLGPGSSSIFSRAPLGLDLVFFKQGVVDRPRWGNRVLWIFCSHQVHNGFPNVFQVTPHFVPYALPNFILLELAANIGLICLRWILLYWGSLQGLVNHRGWANERDSCKIKFWTWNALWTN
jgi:hypothetical protein